MTTTVADTLKVLINKNKSIVSTMMDASPDRGMLTCPQDDKTVVYRETIKKVLTEIKPQAEKLMAFCVSRESINYLKNILSAYDEKPRLKKYTNVLVLPIDQAIDTIEQYNYELTLLIRDKFPVFREAFDAGVSPVKYVYKIFSVYKIKDSDGNIIEETDDERIERCCREKAAEYQQKIDEIDKPKTKTRSASVTRFRDIKRIKDHQFDELDCDLHQKFGHVLANGESQEKYTEVLLMMCNDHYSHEMDRVITNPKTLIVIDGRLYVVRAKSKVSGNHFIREIATMMATELKWAGEHVIGEHSMSGFMPQTGKQWRNQTTKAFGYRIPQWDERRPDTHVFLIGLSACRFQKMFERIASSVFYKVKPDSVTTMYKSILTGFKIPTVMKFLKSVTDAFAKLDEKDASDVTKFCQVKKHFMEQMKTFHFDDPEVFKVSDDFKMLFDDIPESGLGSIELITAQYTKLIAAAQAHAIHSDYRHLSKTKGTDSWVIDADVFKKAQQTVAFILRESGEICVDEKSGRPKTTSFPAIRSPKRPASDKIIGGLSAMIFDDVELVSLNPDNMTADAKFLEPIIEEFFLSSNATAGPSADDLKAQQEQIVTNNMGELRSMCTPELTEFLYQCLDTDHTFKGSEGIESYVDDLNKKLSVMEERYSKLKEKLEKRKKKLIKPATKPKTVTNPKDEVEPEEHEEPSDEEETPEVDMSVLGKTEPEVTIDGDSEDESDDDEHNDSDDEDDETNKYLDQSDDEE